VAPVGWLAGHVRFKPLLFIVAYTGRRLNATNQFDKSKSKHLPRYDDRDEEKQARWKDLHGGFFADL